MSLDRENNLILKKLLQHVKFLEYKLNLIMENLLLLNNDDKEKAATVLSHWQNYKLNK